MHLKRWQRITWRWLVGVLAVLVLLVALMLGLFRTFAPVVPGYRARVEAWASQTLGHPVSIAGMGAQWGLYGPELTLDEVQLLSRDRRRVLLAARQIRIGFTLTAILHGRFSEPNRVILAAPHLTVQRNLDGSYGIVGLEGSAVSGLERTGWRQVLTDALSEEGSVLVRDGTVTLVDMRAPSSPLTFDAIRLNINNARLKHRVSGRLQLPAALGRTLSFALQVAGAGADLQTWKWQAQTAGRALDVPHWAAYWPAFDGRLRSGQLDVRAAAEGVGTEVRSATLSVNARHVAPATSAPGFDVLAGSFTWASNGRGWTLAGHNLQVHRGNDVWPVSEFELQRSQRPAQGASWSGAASFLRLQDIVQLSAWLPADKAGALLRLQQLAPSGDVRALRFAAVRAGGRLSMWSLAGRFEKLGVQTDGKIPGFSGLSGSLVANQDDGALTLGATDASVTFPHLFRGPLPVSTLNAVLKFHHDAQGWHVDLTSLAASNADIAHAEAHGTLLWPAGGGSPAIDLQASVTGVDARNKSVYFPVGIMPKEVVDWLDHAIVSGQVPGGTLELHGKLDDFPYDKGQGLFDIRFHLVQGKLDYAKDWPPLTGLDADVEFKNQGLRVQVRHGRLLNDDIGGTTAQFADLRDGLLRIEGTARGSAQTALAFLHDGPIKERFGHVLDEVQASGTANVKLDLSLPVEHPEQYTLDGAVQLSDAGIVLASLSKWPVTGLNGTVRITQDGISAGQVQGRFLDAPLSLSLQADTAHEATALQASGGAQAAALTMAMPAAFQQALTGEIRWQLDGRLPNKPAASNASLSLVLTSNLLGLDSKLPAPFSKPADTAAPLRAAIRLDAGQRVQLELDYDDMVDGIASLAEQNGAWIFERGSLRLGGGQASLPEQPGLQITGTLPVFSLSDWRAFLPTGTAAGIPASPASLLGADVTIGDFSGFGQHIRDLHLRLARRSDDWQIGVTSAPITGSIAWPLHLDAAHPIVADMQQVDLVRKPPAERTGPPPKLNPRDVPPLVLSIKQLRYNGAQLANVHLELVPQPDGVQLKTFSITDPSFNLHGSGDWRAGANGAETSRLNADLKSTNIERTLQAFGFAPGISGNLGEMQAELHWPGGPLADVMPNLDGKLHVLLRHGSLLDVKPGAGRIFGLLSINALPRRLLLNFSDVLGKGFAYDSIEGNFTLKDGDAYTPDLTLSGPAAKIRMVGRTGLASHDFDEALVVMPSVGPTLPVLGAIAGGVGVGAVVFLLTELFKKPLSQVGETRYHLSGTWDNPKLTEIPAPKPAAGESR